MAKKKKKKKSIVYDLKPVRDLVVDADTLFLGLDPGTANCGIALVGYSNNKIKIIANSVMMNPISDLIDFQEARLKFIKEIKVWMLTSPEGIAAERFQTRGGSSMGKTIECVSAMLGVLGQAYSKTFVKLTIASAWKNKVQRKFGVDLKEIYKTTSIQPHQLDACLIAIYGLEAYLNKNLDYSLTNIIKQAEKASLKIGSK
jgi:Holliday junction resolvasome RuvABC endonuclease subunit